MTDRTPHPKKVHCTIITLDNTSDNGQKLLRDLTYQGLAASFFTAVDGRHQKPVLQGDEMLLPNLTLLRMRRPLSNTELACYLSHLRAVKQAYQQGAEFLCVLEDDVVIEPFFASSVVALADQSLDCVRLMALKIRRRKIVQTLANGITLTRPERGTLGTQAYLLNRSGMAKLLAHATNIYEAIDHVFDHFYLFDLHTYGVEPHLVYELDNGTSVRKPNQNTYALSMLHRLAYHPTKLIYSLRRHWHLWRNRRHYYPAQYPSRRPGKSPRLRGKGAAGRALTQ